MLKNMPDRGQYKGYFDNTLCLGWTVLLLSGGRLKAFLYAFFLFLCAGLVQAQTFDPVEVRTVPSEGYGRIVLTFKDRTLLPHYDAVATGSVLRISFEEPVDINVDDVPVELSDYIAIARRDPDGSAIRFALKNQFQINTLEAGEKLFVDILPMNWEGLPPGLPDDVVRELAKRAEEAMRKVRALEQVRLKSQEGPKVELRIGDHPTFTRLVFDWTIRFDTAFVREDDLIKVTFNHPAQLDISRLRANLPQGVVDATAFLDQGKLKFLMRVEPSVDIRAFREDDTYVIDITPENKEPVDPAKARIDDELNVSGGAEKKGLVVASGVRSPEKTPSQPETVSTGIPAEEESLPSSAQTSADDEAQVFGMPDPDVVSESVEAPDVARPVRQVQQQKPSVQETPVETADQPTQAAVNTSAIPVRKPSKGSEAGVDQSVEENAVDRFVDIADAAASQSKPQTDIPPAIAIDAAPKEPVATDDAEQKPAISAPEAASETVPETTPSTPVAAQETRESVVQDIPVEVVEGEAGTELPPAVALSAKEKTDEAWRAQGGIDPAIESRSPERPPENFAEEARNFVPAEARKIGNTVRIVFPFVEPVSSAVFRRNNSIWMVFDTEATIDTRGIAAALAGTAENIEVEQKTGYQILRMDLTNPVLATVGLDGNAWNLVIGDMIIEPSVPLRLERTIRGDGGSVLRVIYKDPQNIREIVDPFVGDRIALVTGFGPPRGLLKPQQFVDLEALSSAQGFAMAVKSDGVTFKILGDDVIIEKTGGLSLSNKRIGGSLNLADIGGKQGDEKLIDFANLSSNKPAAYNETLQQLHDNLAKAPEKQRHERMMELSRFYLANQFPQEAIGIMRLAVQKNPEAAEDSGFNLLMGAAQALAGHSEVAMKYLNRPELQGNPDASVWQTIVDVQLGDWPAARMSIPSARAVIGNYPKSLQTEFNLAAAQAMVESNDFGMATSILSEIEPSQVSKPQAARYDIIRGRIADASGRSQEALTAFDLVSKSGDMPRVAEAEYRALRIRHRDGDITTDEAIDQLTRLATYWRGDEIELKTLRFLAQLQAENGNYRMAFEAMKSAVQADSDSDTTRLLQEEMNALFVSLFLDGKADEMKPVDALSLYYDFREMTPIGRQGDEMVRGLARRLVEMDLLDQSIELLRHQVDHRLKGAARSQVAADLAAIYLLDHKPQDALRVLNVTRQASLPSTLERQRNIVEARALTASGRPDLALELVRNMRGTDVERLRADTFWAAESWREAGEQLEGMHGGRWGDAVPLDEQERQDILKAAIAYSLAGDQLSLTRLKTKYADKMADSPHSAAFEVVTRAVEDQGVEFLEVANKFSSADAIDTFMDEYRRQYMMPESTTGSVSGASQTPES